MKRAYQTTLRSAVSLSGIGVHSGKEVQVVLRPADVNHGIKFLRTGLPQGRERLINAKYVSVSATALCTVVGDEESGAVSTVEHLMAALYGLGIDNALIDINGAEMPILDGSAAPFVEALDNVGLVKQHASRRYVKVLKPVRVENGRSFSELVPNDRGFRLDVDIDFDSSAIGRQRMVTDLSPDVFRRDISRARTFGFMSDVEKLWKVGFALGSSLENSVAIDGDRILNPEGLRYPDEFVRHKLLDAVGDLSLAGMPLLATYRSYCGGHKMNFLVLEALFSDRSNYAIVEAAAPREKLYPSEAGVPLGALAYAPETR